MNPRITVLMSVYNGEQYLRESIESILGQSFTDFEFLIINDASSDESVEIIESYNDERIILIHNETNLRLSKSLNKGLAMSKGEFVARMDADDIAYPDRLEKQLNYMAKYPEVDILGSGLKIIGKEEIWQMKESDEEIRPRFLFFTNIFHPTAFFKKSVVDKYNLKYPENYRYAQDYALWAGCIPKPIRFGNIQEVLLEYRIINTVESEEKKAIQKSNTSKIRLKQLQNLEIELSEQDFSNYISICDNYKAGETLLDVQNGLRILNEIYNANKIKNIYSHEFLKEFFDEVAFFVAYNAHYDGLKVYKEYKKTVFSTNEGNKKLFDACFRMEKKNIKKKIKNILSFIGRNFL